MFSLLAAPPDIAIDQGSATTGDCWEPYHIPNLNQSIRWICNNRAKKEYHALRVNVLFLREGVCLRREFIGLVPLRPERSLDGQSPSPKKEDRMHNSREDRLSWIHICAPTLHGSKCYWIKYSNLFAGFASALDIAQRSIWDKPWFRVRCVQHPW